MLAGSDIRNLLLLQRVWAARPHGPRRHIIDSLQTASPLQHAPLSSAATPFLRRQTIDPHLQPRLPSRTRRVEHRRLPFGRAGGEPGAGSDVGPLFQGDHVNILPPPRWRPVLLPQRELQLGKKIHPTACGDGAREVIQGNTDVRAAIHVLFFRDSASEHRVSAGPNRSPARPSSSARQRGRTSSPPPARPQGALHLPRGNPGATPSARPPRPLLHRNYSTVLLRPPGVYRCRPDKPVASLSLNPATPTSVPRLRPQAQAPGPCGLAGPGRPAPRSQRSAVPAVNGADARPPCSPPPLQETGALDAPRR